MVAESNMKTKFDILASGTDGQAVTPSDSTELTKFARALYIGGAGDVVIVTTAGTSLTFVGLLAGTILPMQCKQVKSTGTTATDIIAVW